MTLYELFLLQLASTFLGLCALLGLFVLLWNWRRLS